MNASHKTPILTPLHKLAHELNAQFLEVAGWQIPAVFTSVEAETAVAQSAVTICDQGANGKIRVQGMTAGDMLQAGDLAIGTGKGMAYGGVYRLRHDLFFISTSPGSETAGQLAAQATTATELISVTDVTHGHAEILLIGPQSAALLGRLCGLDFHDTQFPDWTAKQSSVAKTPQLIIRRDIGDLPAYSLVGDRSFGVYLWETAVSAGRDLSLAPLGQSALDVLRSRYE
jgi:heterotetrameric sarcosine oxidase gamma subunit